MSKRVVAINCSPRKTWNTATLVREAAEGAREAGAEVELIDLYDLEPLTGCRSCFGCKTEAHLATCVWRDGMTGLLEMVRQADGLVVGTPNYLGDTSAGFRALLERLTFPYISYKVENPSYNERPIPVVFILTSNASEDLDADVVRRNASTLNYLIGPTEVLVCGETLQVNDYERYGWTMFDHEQRRERRKEVFPQERQRAYQMGRDLLTRG